MKESLDPGRRPQIEVRINSTSESRRRVGPLSQKKVSAAVFHGKLAKRSNV